MNWESWVIATTGIVAMWLIGSKKVAGLWLSLAGQVMWVVYAIYSQQYGFLLGAIVYGAVCIRNIRRWSD